MYSAITNAHLHSSYLNTLHSFIALILKASYRTISILHVFFLSLSLSLSLLFFFCFVLLPAIYLIVNITFAHKQTHAYNLSNKDVNSECNDVLVYLRTVFMCGYLLYKYKYWVCTYEWVWTKRCQTFYFKRLPLLSYNSFTVSV